MPQLLDRYLGWTELPAELLDGELEFFRLTDADLEFVRGRFYSKHQLAGALLVGFTKLTGSKLERFDQIPPELLRFIATQLGAKPPRIATLRSLYPNRQRLWEHQVKVLAYLGYENYSKQEERQLLAFLRDSCRHTSSVDRLAIYANQWLHDRKRLIPAASSIRRVAVQAAKETDTWLYVELQKCLPKGRSEEWYEKLRQPLESGSSKTVLEWLQTPPGRKIRESFLEMKRKADYLKSIGVPLLNKMPGAPQERLEDYFRRLQNMKPSLLKSMGEFNRTIHICCFLKIALGRANDVLYRMEANTVRDTWSEAHRHILKAQPKTIKEFKGALNDFVMLSDQDLNDPQVQAQIKELANKYRGVAAKTSRAAEVRARIADGNSKIRPMLKVMLDQDIKTKPGDKLGGHIELLKKLYKQGKTELPNKKLEVAGIWDDDVNKEKDRKRAMHAFEYAVASELRRKIRGGDAWDDDSSDHRNPDEMLITPKAWATSAAGHYDRLRLPRKPDKFIDDLVGAAEEKVALVAKKVREGEVKLSGSGISYPDITPDPLFGVAKMVKRTIEGDLPMVQLPEVMLFGDAKMHYSTQLLGRAPESAAELRLVYAALLAMGTDGGAKGMAMMIEGVSEEQIADMMRRLQQDRALERANQVVLQNYHGLPLAQRLGDGTSASADMMALPTSRHLWNSRVDYRRKTASIGLYDHILDNMSYVYNQPIVLGNRQAGAAIHGVVSQTEIQIERLAVDTHGVTDASMGFAKGLGFDICPHLRNLKERRLCLPRGATAPAGIESVVDCGISLDLIRARWDDYVRVVASISNATCSAVTVLERFGSAAHGNKTYLAAKHLGRLQRTIFLCDYLTNPEFFAENRRLLNQGENSHKLKRALHSAQLSHERGREKDEMIAISSSLTLIANIIQYWNAYFLWLAIQKAEEAGLPVTDRVISSLSPCRFANINLSGEYEFGLGKYASLLLPVAYGTKVRAISRA